MKKSLIIDGASVAGKEQLHARFAAAFDFPDYYGANLDALFDCLGDLGCEAEIRVINASALDRTLGGDYAEKLRGVLSDAEREFGKITVEFVG